MAAELLFVYGTLMRGFGLHTLLEGRADFVGEASTRARLVDLGRYPGAVRDSVGAVHGEVYRIADSALLAALDSAEGPQYHRDQTQVSIVDRGDVTAFIYWYVGALDRGVPIPGGDYRTHGPARSIHLH
jgi:gamma-glutamylcyclotransferase (GGCT)/AIG2-like uncharacterized protein YtfP